MKCKVCGHEIKSGEKACPQCGTMLLHMETLKMCPKCGWETMEHERCCKKCGSQLINNTIRVEKPQPQESAQTHQPTQAPTKEPSKAPYIMFLFGFLIGLGCVAVGTVQGGKAVQVLGIMMLSVAAGALLWIIVRHAMGLGITALIVGVGMMCLGGDEDKKTIGMVLFMTSIVLLCVGALKNKLKKPR